VLLVAVLSSAPFLLTSPFLLLLSVERKNWRASPFLHLF
jgi:hypothetical protein